MLAVLRFDLFVCLFVCLGLALLDMGVNVIFVFCFKLVSCVR